MSTIDSANPPQEFPDIVGARPTNPLAANFKSFIPASANLPELTWPHLVTGTILGIIFGASSLYLVLKVGLTVSASIPVAVLSITIFRLASKFLRSRDATILQHNIVQTTGSAGESIAFGLGVTMPAIMILGFDLEITRVILVAVLGGLLGILMMIPLRRALIVAEHGVLKYPEGTACAEVLKAAVSKESIAVADKTHTTANAEIVNQEAASGGGKVIFTGFGIGLLYQAAMGAFRMWKDTPEKIFGAPLKGASISATIEPALLGVGYITGPRIASIMCAGGVLSYLVLIPAIKFFGDNVTGPVAPGTIPISQMGPDDIREAYILISAPEQLLLAESSACFDRFPQYGMDCEADCRICWANTVCADMRPERIAICQCASWSLVALQSSQSSWQFRSCICVEIFSVHF
jgi:hypothetical protein